MHFEKDNIYHVYNRSNEQVFFSRDNYLLFLRKINDFIKPNCEILAWCLMPNHFHFLIQATAKSEENINESHREQTQLLSKNFGILLSSYTRAINKQLNRKGKLWSHNTEAKRITNNSYSIICLHYIHQNPVVAKLTEKMSDYEFSSYIDFLGKRNGKLANRQLAYELTGMDKDNFIEQSEFLIDEKIIKEFYS